MSTGSEFGPIDVQKLSIHNARPAVTRLNRSAVLLTGALVAMIVLGVVFTSAGDRGAIRRESAPENAARPDGPSEPVRDLPRDYSFDVQKGGKSIDHAAPRAPATRPTGTTPRAQAIDEQLRQAEESRRKALEERRRESESAMDSPLIFANVRSPSAPSMASSTLDPVAEPPPVNHGRSSDFFNAAAAAAADDGAAGATGRAAEGRRVDKEGFFAQAAAIEPSLHNPLLSPLSQYELKAGSVISGALITAIDTDLPGEVVGQVTENVYDSATGDHLLIPQGSRLLGKYQSFVGNGQNRALLAWRRLIYPDGRSIELDAMPGVDPTGQAGLADRLDRHPDKLAEAAALTTAIAYAGNLARGPRGAAGADGRDVIGDTLVQQAVRIGDKVLDRELDVQPTISVRQGWPFRVLVNKDMRLARYAGAR